MTTWNSKRYTHVRMRAIILELMIYDGVILYILSILCIYYTEEAKNHHSGLPRVHLNVFKIAIL